MDMYMCLCFFFVFFFFFKQKTAYEMLRSLVGSEMCIRDRLVTVSAALGPCPHADNAPMSMQAINKAIIIFFIVVYLYNSIRVDSICKYSKSIY